MAGRLRVTQVKSTIGHIARNRGTIRALGLRRIGDTVEVPDNPATRGMVRQVRFLVSVESLGSGEPAGRARTVSQATPDASSQAEETEGAVAEATTAERPGGEETAPEAPAAKRPTSGRARKAASTRAEEGS
jgi:large subunit ribosomal protein L30